MNSKGSVVIYSIMLGITIIILALALAPTVSQFTQNSMNQSTTQNLTYEFINDTGDVQVINGTIENVGLDCDNSTINNFNKATCVVVDFGMAYFIIGLILIAGAVVGAKILIG